jgi:hypothetical protein
MFWSVVASTASDPVLQALAAPYDSACCGLLLNFRNLRLPLSSALECMRSSNLLAARNEFHIMLNVTLNSGLPIFQGDTGR